MFNLLRITYLLESTELWGGNKVVFEQAEALSEIGYDVTILSKDSGPDWYKLRLPVKQVPSFNSNTIPESDIVIGTYWSTVRPAHESNKGVTIHLCQGYEGDFKELQHRKAEIDEVYLLKIPKLTVSPHLDKFLKERFNAETYYIGQMINRGLFYPSHSPIHPFTHSPVKILIVGPFEADVKNISTALRGISIAKRRLKIPINVIRVSQCPLSKKEEDIIKPTVYYFHIPFSSMGEIYRNATLLISISKEAEGFGLPALEAMACGIPTILSRIPSYMSLDERQDYALFVDPTDAKSVAMAIKEMVNNKDLREHLIKRGLEVSAKFTKEEVIKRLTSAFGEILRKDKLMKTKKFWDGYHLTMKSEQRIHWWDSPIIMEHCQRLVTGNPKTDIYKFLKDNFIHKTLEQGLSICSGSGEFERGLIDRGICKRIDAYEISDERASEGRRIAKEKNYPITFHIEDVNKAFFKKNHYDIFFSWSALHHIENLEGVCENVSEALKDRGLLVIQEFVGPSQFQWTDKQLEIANKILNLLPERLRTHQIDGTLITEKKRPSIDEMNKIDPSEAIRSEEIIPVIERYFDVKMIRYFGGSIFNLLFNGIIGNFDHDNENDIALIKLILLLEETLIEEHILNSDYAVIIAEKS
ncbi:MAG: glycosyltransferase [Thermodesulfovibrionales bacterium]